MWPSGANGLGASLAGESRQARRPRFRFTLRALLIVTTLVCLVLAYPLNWMRQRRTALATDDVTTVQLLEGTGLETSAPWALRLFGERGEVLLIVHDVDDDDWPAREQFLSGLFPEAEIRRGAAEPVFIDPESARRIER